MMETVNTHEAKSRLSEIIRKVENGVDVVVARNGVPVVRIIPWTSSSINQPGVWKDKVTYEEGYDIIGSDDDIQELFDESTESEL